MPTNNKGIDTIHFRLTEYNNMVVQGVLNGTDTVQLMFHTAADAVALTMEGTKQLHSLQFEGSTDSIKSWGGQDNSSRLSKANTLQLGSLVYKEVPVWEDGYSGQHTDGKFGINLFDNRVVSIDYDKNLILLSGTLPRDIKTYHKQALIVEHGSMFIMADCITGQATLANKFLLHSGYAGAVLLDDVFANDNRLAEQLPLMGEKSLKDAYGNIVKTKKVVLPGLAMGGQLLSNVPAGFFEGAIGRQKMSLLGGDVLRRFNWVIDAQRKYVYCKPGRWYAAPYTGI
jgi:hypothetical protein